jgi:LmbE family N-acetylglucosaminyl deacetylase
MRRHTLVVLATAWIAFVIPPATSAAAQERPRVLVALLAHPDDEGAASPVLARYAREGVEVQLIVASDGAAGSGTRGYLVRPDSGAEGGALARQRAEEARCAAAALGTREPILLGFPDGKLGDYSGDPSLMYRLTERIAREIERLRPDVVITWGPDGGTGHPDHRLVGNIATQLQRASAPGMPERLFYMYLPVEAFRLLNPQRGEPPMLLPQEKYFTMHVPFTPLDLEAGQKAMTCHRSQFTAETLRRLLPEQGRVWNGKVAFVPAFAAASGGDLFR